MSLFALIVVTFTIIANSIIALVSYLNNPKSWTNKLISFLALIFASWTLFNYFALLPNDETMRLFWVRVVMLVTSPMGVATFLLAFIFPNEPFVGEKKYIYPVIVLAVITGIVSMTPLVFARVDNLPNNNFALVPGIGIVLFAINHMGLTTAGLVILVRKFLRSKGLLRQQFQWFLIGTILTLTLITLSNFVAVVFFKTMEYTFIGPLFTLFEVGFILYAVMKTRFLDIRLVVARSVAYTLLISILGILYISVLIFIGLFEGTDTVDLNLIITFTIPALLIAFSFQSILRTVEYYTDKIFYRRAYDVNELLSAIGHIVISTFQLEALTAEIMHKLTAAIRISYGFFMLYHSDGSLTVHGLSEDIKIQIDKKEYLSLVQKVESNPNKMVLFEEIDESPQKELMRQNSIHVISLLVVKNEAIGIICLGEKLSGDVYSEEDVRVLKILINETAVAIKNALSVSEIQRFNITLKQEIDKATSDLKYANNQLQELDKLKDEFVSLASHELRTPMTAIKGSLSTILEGYAGDVSDQAKEFLTAAYNENDRLLRLVNNLLNISRIEAGRLKFEIHNIKLDSIISDIIANLHSAAEEKSLFLKSESDGQLPPVKADGDMVKEVLINIIGNAIKYTHRGGITVKTKADERKVTISITDTGSGIAKEDQLLLFKKFSQIQGDYARTQGGTGLGLYISKKIIEGMGGEIWLESKLGVGSTFLFSLPISN
ncbi:hypothetical protein A2154_02965 [Candidatus Gottesmanbacteria bacterium RBG_16_43_7]|uniref:histidine kinase n=1 Tax=Candidatus Gottesmanbacteria bacterium RBG_16_43_7 TaxID=1798373 RepID=A0A1F5Z8X3_9BACT|nr:MAG: hypothetical protein A2154_02965 [Candidatus Gottesmanbacteria bacterium RBG_16_43_7]